MSATIKQGVFRSISLLALSHMITMIDLLQTVTPPSGQKVVIASDVANGRILPQENNMLNKYHKASCWQHGES